MVLVQGKTFISILTIRNSKYNQFDDTDTCNGVFDQMSYKICGDRMWQNNSLQTALAAEVNLNLKRVTYAKGVWNVFTIFFLKVHKLFLFELLEGASSPWWSHCVC